MIWRDDDIGADTDQDQLQRVDDIFQAFGVEHTIAVIAKGIGDRDQLIRFIKDRKMSVQLHCWAHDDLTVTEKARVELGAAVIRIEDCFGVRPTVLYPPWNRTNAAVEARAVELGLTVSHRKVSLDAFIRAGGDVDIDTVNFHYWHPSDVALLPEALSLYTKRKTDMKPTDYAPRAAMFDTHLKWSNMVGVEVGVDAGAHAEALLRHCPIEKIYLVDKWEREYPLGICTGRLWALGFKSKFEIVHKASVEASKRFEDRTLHFVYIDQHQDKAVVESDLAAWWPKLANGGILGQRNYAATNPGLVEAVDEFIAKNSIGKEFVHVYPGEIVLVKP